MSIKERALARRKQVQSVAVPMPEWGQGTVVHVREMTAMERDAHEVRQSELTDRGEGMRNWRASLVSVTAHDADGNRIFDAADLDALGELPSAEVRRLYDAAAKLNGLTSGEEKAVEKKS